MLDDSLKYNDYQYILPHLMDKYPLYNNFMLNYVGKPNSFIIMDNGLFEGVTHTHEDLLEKINLIKPNIFIVPDEWNDSVNTYKNAKYWYNILKDKVPTTTKFMVVMQGENVSDVELLYAKCKDLGYAHFAFNHSSIMYQNMFSHPNKLVNQMIGRQHIINVLRNKHVIENNDYIHLLGCSLPQEGLFYKDAFYDFINSVDTSSPIINGALNVRYTEFGLTTKPTTKIEDILINQEMNPYIKYNIKKFKELWQNY
jgi:hypothetical protein